MKILDRINNVNDLKKLDFNDLSILRDEIFSLIYNRVNSIGGHLGSNLGVIELTIALHYVFDSPKDKIIFDVSHQCYTHKILTGRKEYFEDPQKYNQISGFLNPNESEHDIYRVGHTSTSLSYAFGEIIKRDLTNQNYNVISVIGDGSLSGGEAFEGLNNLGNLNSNCIIIVNDNEMSISENHGSLYKNLAELKYNHGNCENNFFKSLGFEYEYLENGNSLNELIALFKKYKDINKPVVLHIKTIKGNGSDFAISNKEYAHSVLPNFQELFKNEVQTQKTFATEITNIYRKINNEKNVVFITAGTPHSTSLTPKFREELGDKYIDIGIAEQSLLTIASSFKNDGITPIIVIESTFLPRAYDQLINDIALNNSKCILMIYNAGFSTIDETHMGLFDISIFNSVPNIKYFNPTSLEQIQEILEAKVNNLDSPIAIRIPKKAATYTDFKEIDFKNNYFYEEKGQKIAILHTGFFKEYAIQLKQEITKNFNVKSSLVSPLIVNSIDKNFLDELALNHDIIITLEDSFLQNGFGSLITSYFSKNNKVTCLNYGAKLKFYNRISLEDFLKNNNMSLQNIIEDIKNIIE